MRAVSNRFRRFVASLMLVAMASFGLHNGALAGVHPHGASQIECGADHRHAQAPDESASVGDLHNAGQHHHHDHGPEADLPDAAGEPTSAGFDGSCCTGSCAVAATAPILQGILLPCAVGLRQLPGARTGAAAILDGLKRPPRTRGIA